MKMLKYILITMSAMMIAGCGSDDEGFSEVKSGHEQHDNHKPTLDASVEVKGSKALIRIKTDMEISKKSYGGEKKDGQGHIHMYVDNGEKQGITSTPVELNNLSPGEHVVKISLHNNDHTPFDVTEKLTFTIK
ncbi:hypothetical protein ACFQPF_08130 [Fictibacillus iocasae]|uniref:DUF4399 domain-containing protein n=1 Tax=Fictibacillus iocasae TaxID=2715437 RepID=A0ABW2NLY7_9BACL